MTKRSKILKIGLAGVIVLLLVVFTIWGAIWVSNINNRKAASAYPKCEGKHLTHKVTIQNDKMRPRHTDAKRCDTLVITNLDNQPRIIAFGVHDKHVAYDGVTERYLSDKGTFQVRLIQPGTFKFHDHNQEEVAGTFTVTP